MIDKYVDFKLLIFFFDGYTTCMFECKRVDE